VPGLSAVARHNEVKVEFVQMRQEERRKTLLPGQVATGLDPRTGAVISRVVGRVPNDGSTRQQRRAAERGNG
jgi:hypothetical protein